MEDSIIELHNLTKNYGTFTAVNRLSLSIRKGEIFGLLGPNGAGKSTTILMMLGLSEPSEGSVSVCGINATQDPISVKKRVGYLPDDVGFYDNYSGLENILYTARLNSILDEIAYERAMKLLNWVGLADVADKKAGKYSRGMRQRLGLADVLIKNPEVIILDEPTLGIDPKGVRELLHLIVQLSKREGITVILSSHHLQQVQQVCDRIGLFVGGKLLAEGDIPALSRKLFTNEAFAIHLKINLLNSLNPEAEKHRLMDTLKKHPKVLEVKFEDDFFQISCSSNIIEEIAKMVVDQNFLLTYLHQKEYGLEEIYHRYFAGKEEVNVN